MNTQESIGRPPRFMIVYELLIWFLYVGLYKYGYYLENVHIPVVERANFPRPQLIIYALAMTAYIIPFYRWIVPHLLRRKKYLWLSLSIPLYFEFVPKISNWLINRIFLMANGGSNLHNFLQQQDFWFTLWLKSPAGWDLQIMLTDFIAFLSIAFIRFAFESEQKKHLLEQDNLVLQLESLKAQLHPHFLFNTLNSIYGMSLAGSPETPDYILKLSDMMRFILYDCRHHQVPLEKDIEFMENYIAMERRRYPSANILFTTTGEDTHRDIAPLLFIPFVENGFKHGSHRVIDHGGIRGHLNIENDKLHFELENDILLDTRNQAPYGGVGIENVRRRLELYYPGQHQLTLQNDQHVFKVTLKIHF